MLSLINFTGEFRISFPATDLGGVLVLLIIAIINYMFLYQFLLTKRTYLYGIYKVCGMSNCQVLGILFVELLGMLMISYAAAMLLYTAGLFLMGIRHRAALKYRNLQPKIPTHIPR